ncbi:MAG: hypothetical protein E7513_06775 [Ruminococcaceae bacterium]|nr:hypothetical protein [Oscillospiraceae bacterium]
MIVVSEFKQNLDSVERVLFKSDSGFKIRKLGTDSVFDSAVELKSVDVEYEETDILAIESSEVYG